jgi:AcrR family transcriptional regulator
MKPSKAREPLSREAIVRAAFSVIEAEGMAEFSTRKLARALHCEAMSIYHYFPSKAHLLDAMVDHAVTGMRPVPEGMELRAALLWVLREFRAMGLRYPAFFPILAVHRMNTRAALAWLDRTTGLLRQAGFSDRMAAQLFRALGYYVVGATLDETAGYARGPGTVEPVPEAEMAERYPNVVAVGAYFGKEYWDATFELGANMLVDATLAQLAGDKAEARV